MKRSLLAAALALATTFVGANAASAASSTAAPEAPFGPGCPAAADANVAAIAGQPVATAASRIPELSTLVGALKEAGLADKLNTAQDITVFAPTNEAFAAVPKGTLDKVLANRQALTKILTYHVAEGRQAPADLADARLTTLEGGSLTVRGSGDSYTVNTAKVVCGNVPTGNASVYVIDKVLMPE
ncbi:fasciclin domain-containing protein [Nonomuraea sp. 3-1Str]|uniref:fasciclin domain-containing protein n=1 Tax=Nonomuraea sp. 3-1Str TaxID=2929801 RepID=UPI00285D1530|nr:fasciclin domain-containing protein [Nonomuraea sp. 3-1Str]MDR8411670.1 fasciclin domain-containing protein [Nonomuraea sp. 3-1Str]